MNKKLIQVENLTVCYREGGAGKTLLILHGWGLDSSIYGRLCEMLEKEYHIVCLDLPGFGETDTPAEVWGVSEYRRFVLKFLDALKINRVNILAHSFGGRIAIKLATQDAERVGKLIMTGAAGIKPRNSIKKMIFLVAAKAGNMVMSLPGLNKCKRLARKVLYRLAGQRDYLEARGIMKKILAHVVSEDLTSHLPDIQARTLLVWGAMDTFTRLRDGELMKRLIPHSILKVYNDVGHRLPFLRPEEMAEDIRTFL